MNYISQGNQLSSFYFDSGIARKINHREKKNRREQRQNFLQNIYIYVPMIYDSFASTIPIRQNRPLASGMLVNDN